LTIEARDQTTEGHCQRLASYATALGTHVGLGSDDLEALHRGAFLHDIGKIGVPDSVLMKRGRLTPQEFDLIKTHTIIGDRLCGELRLLKGVRPIVRSHHERLDGSGYPDGLRGRNIPLLAQIVSVVDVFDALTTRRPYKEPYESERAYQELTIEVERGWRDRELVDAFIALARRGLMPAPATDLVADRSDA
jgi:putative two-component system response regulator